MYLCFDTQGMHESVARVEKLIQFQHGFFIVVVFAYSVLIVQELSNSIAN